MNFTLQPCFAGSVRLSTACHAGTYYERLPGGGRSLFSPNEDAKKTGLVSMRVYVAAGGGVEYELDGLSWKTKRVEA